MKGRDISSMALTTHMLNLDIYFTIWLHQMVCQAALMSVNVAFVISQLWYIDIGLPWYQLRCYRPCGLRWQYWHLEVLPWVEELRYWISQITTNRFIAKSLLRIFLHLWMAPPSISLVSFDKSLHRENVKDTIRA